MKHEDVQEGIIYIECGPGTATMYVRSKDKVFSLAADFEEIIRHGKYLEVYSSFRALIESGNNTLFVTQKIGNEKYEKGIENNEYKDFPASPVAILFPVKFI